MQREEEEETSILQSLSKDLQTVQKLVEDTVRPTLYALLSSRSIKTPSHIEPSPPSAQPAPLGSGLRLRA